MLRQTELERPDAVIFDWDSTLVDNWQAIADALNAALNAFGLPDLTLREVRDRARASAR